MLLDVNEVLLKQLGSSVLSDAENSSIIEPCSIGKGCRIANSVVGPNVSIAEDSVVENCILRRTIVGSGSHLENVSLTDTIVGDRVQLKGSIRKMNIGDNTEIEL
jgi:glucose-1-phosphate thymidylyltransferase